jgi:protein-tyrosine phosphatase
MNQIQPHPLWVGHAGDGAAFRRLFDLGMEAVVQLSAEEPPLPLPRDLVLCHFPLIDGIGNRPALLSLAIETTAVLVRSRTPTLVCCGAGMSRSPAVAAAALTLAYGGPPEDWLRLVTEHHPSDVSPGLWDEVRRLLVNPRPA